MKKSGKVVIFEQPSKSDSKKTIITVFQKGKKEHFKQIQKTSSEAAYEYYPCNDTDSVMVWNEEWKNANISYHVWNFEKEDGFVKHEVN